MNPYFIAGSVVAVVLAYGVGHWQGDDAGQAKIQAKWDQERAKLAEEYAANVTAMREKEQAMQGNADKLRQEKDRELKKVADTNKLLLDSLRHRPERTEGSGVSQTPGTGQSSCTGKELYRQDSEFLIGIAREADELRIALKQCYAQYDSLK
jgi:hypothetical protein